jgi:ribosomal protein S18 acetylase RimI-like enzyme
MPSSVSQPAQRRLTPADADAAAEVLARAFVGDPLWRYLFPEPGRRAAMALQAFRAFAPGFIADFVALGVGAPLEGVAVWAPPGQEPPRPEALLNANLLALVFSPFLAAIPRVAPVFSQFEALQRRYAAEPHYYLSTVGVLPEARGRGRASALIRPMLDLADARGFPTYTETMTAENVPLYERYGFVVRAEVKVAGTALRVWALQRPRLAG